MARILRKPTAPKAPPPEPKPAPAAPKPQAERPARSEGEGGNRTDYGAVIKRYEDKVRNPLTGIRAKCVQCCCGQLKEVQLCAIKECALHPFRMGINPFNKKTAERMARESEGDEDED